MLLFGHEVRVSSSSHCCRHHSCLISWHLVLALLVGVGVGVIARLPSTDGTCSRSPWRPSSCHSLWKHWQRHSGIAWCLVSCPSPL
eukprot:4259506-Karenia_brevis.AAC.1